MFGVRSHDLDGVRSIVGNLEIKKDRLTGSKGRFLKIKLPCDLSHGRDRQEGA
jgi:hypothetical protein